MNKTERDALQWPPYGELARAYRESIEKTGLVPPDWSEGTEPQERERLWLAWRESVLAVINETLWPRWDESTQAWRNADSARMHALTEADFSLFQIINEEMRFLDRPPATPNAAAGIPPHRRFFLDEDGEGVLGERYLTYDTTLPLKYVTAIPQQLSQSLKAKTGSASLQFKSQLQRPRAYQVAKLLGKTHTWEVAATSMSPSMSSGHSLQGCMMAAGVFENWLQSGFQPTPEQRQSLQQFAVDIGDRRVFAGVHYPSDNLASWWIALSLAPKVFRRAETLRFLWEAITGRSIVFAHIREAAEKTSPVYRPMLGRILQAGQESAGT